MVVATCPRVWATPEATPLAPEQPAPFEGVLVPPEQAVTALRCLSVGLPKCQNEARSASQRCATARTALEAIVEAERARADALDESLRNLGQAEVPEPSWWKHHWLWGIVGAAVGAATTIGVIEIRDRLK